MPVFFFGPDSEADYLRWRDENPASYILNTRKRPTASSLILHRALCHLTAMPNPTRQYSKICGTEAGIADFIRTNLGHTATMHRCAFCHR